MKTKTRKAVASKKMSKATRRPIKASAHKKPSHSVRAHKGVGTRKPPTAVHAKPRSSGPRSGDSDRGLYVRFENPQVKADVMAYAEKAGISMNGFIVAATLKAIAEGWKPEMKPEAVEERKTA